GRALEIRKTLVAHFRSALPEAVQRHRGLAVSGIKLANLSLDVGNPQNGRRYAEDALEAIRTAPQTDPKKARAIQEAEGSALSALA
ncbi:MAG TPA: hypothetical protein VKJ00_05835, partial [Thermoanaerobaculia bacterium]|nr:hypothetical protein [Thermoanaerobaculia bacterium]